MTYDSPDQDEARQVSRRPGDGTPTCSFTDLFARFEQGPRVPLSVQLELTTHCNSRCVHCYVVQSQGYAPEVLPTQLALDLLDAAVVEGTLCLTLTGGEPLLHQDFELIYRSAVHHGFLIKLLTNATLVDERAAKLLEELPPREVSVSVYGASQATYAAVTGNPLGFGAMSRGLALLAEAGVPLRLKFMALRENKDDLPAVLEMSRQLGAAFGLDGGVTPAADFGAAPLLHALSPRALAAAECAVPAAREELSATARSEMRAEGDRAYQCMAGVDRLFVSAGGMMSVCVEEPQCWPLDPQDVLGSFRRIFYDEFPRFLAEGALAPECRECDLWALCRRCPAWRHKITGDRGGKVPYFCELARHEALLCASGEDVAL